MSGFNEEALLKVLNTACNTFPNVRRPGPNVFIETGTYKGERSLMARPHFRWLHTIEANPYLWAQAYTPLTEQGIIPHLGDSGDVLGRLTRVMNESVFFFLDAHWGPSGGMDYKGAGFPLWKELAAIREHAYGRHDIVVVDDLRSFGTSNPTYDWELVTCERIFQLLNAKSTFLLDDQAVFLL